MLGLTKGENSVRRRPYNGANEVYGVQLVTSPLSTVSILFYSFLFYTIGNIIILPIQNA